MQLPEAESQLCNALHQLPDEFSHRYSDEAGNKLVQLLFLSLCAQRRDYLALLFPQGIPSSNSRWSLRLAQGAVEGSEYTEAARGHPCGHIFKPGEATYRCRTCTNDDTCVLCAKCFNASDHEGHPVYITISHGNAGCCDCGDPEAWLLPVHCSIHSVAATSDDSSDASRTTGKAKAGSGLPPDLVEAIQMTIARAMDYLCDVWSCAPEQLRQQKTEQSVRQDELMSRLSGDIYGGGNGGCGGSSGDDGESASNAPEAGVEYALVLWNDEKHTVEDVRDIVARACKMSNDDAREKANQVDVVGRSILKYSTDLAALCSMAKIIEEPKLSVTIRSSRDIFREQMCGTMIEWISDIAGCSVGRDSSILRSTICQEILKEWRVGSAAHHKSVGEDGLYDHDGEDVVEELLAEFGRYPSGLLSRMHRAWRANFASLINLETGTELGEAARGGTGTAGGAVIEDADTMEIDDQAASTVGDNDTAMDTSDGPEDYLEAQEATLAGYPPPPPPPLPAPPFPPQRNTTANPSISDDGDLSDPLMAVPRTPAPKVKTLSNSRPPNYWLEKPDSYSRRSEIPLAEDLWRRVRLDWLILYDLRMWKQLRIDMREVLISTVVTLPEFKRLLGLRFAGVYTVLAELYLIADREPEHSVITLSIQMLTTASINAEVIERGNFLTNLMAIIYTFLTTRQVGYPIEVNLGATLAVDQGVVFNRRAHHFYHDMKCLLSMEIVQDKIRREPRYLLQFLDVTKIHQGICPNVRAVGEHLEYEMEAWMSISNVTSEIMKLCRAISESFILRAGDTAREDVRHLQDAVRTAAGVTIINSIGSEKRRFEQSEIKHLVKFKNLHLLEEEDDHDHDDENNENDETATSITHIGQSPNAFRVVDFSVEKEPMSCYHALHYTLAWLVDRAKSIPAEEVRQWLLFTANELRSIPMPVNALPLIPEYQPIENLLAMFDYPIRVCAWMAQMRTGMWVRNGLSLRHQIQQYKSVSRRELTYQRDVFLVQLALVVCPPATILATLIDRFDLGNWAKGDYAPHNSREEPQTIDIVEDFVHLLIIVLCDRLNLISEEQDPDLLAAITRRELTHVLCFKPLSFTELDKQLTERVKENDDFETLEKMTTFKPPEGMTDHGTFTLKEEYLAELDPYLPYLSRNQREEAENLYRKHMAKKTGQDSADVVYEPKLRPIEIGLFKDIAAFTRTTLFAQTMFYFVQYAMMAPGISPDIPATKIEQFLQFVLHLILVAVLADESDENSMTDDDVVDASSTSFCTMALNKKATRPIGQQNTIAGLLRRSTEMTHLKSCEPKIRAILRHLRHKRPSEYQTWMVGLNMPVERSNNSSPAPLSATAAMQKELKKKQALERQAKVMAQFKQQQDTFLQNQAIDWGEDDFDDLGADDLDFPMEQTEKTWKYPAGPCILCQEETNGDKLYGTFALINESHIFRQTDTQDPDWVEEVFDSPKSLDRSADDIRPFGVAGKNRKTTQKIRADGSVAEFERQDLAKGFPWDKTVPGPVSIGCGHIMHFACFEVYIQATHRRHAQQIARNQPENLSRNEFLCPLCKALGNAFLPIIWKGKTMSYPGALGTETTFEDFLTIDVTSKLEPRSPETNLDGDQYPIKTERLFLNYGEQEFITPLASKLSEFTHQPTKFQLPNLPRVQLPFLPFGAEIQGFDMMAGTAQEPSSSTSVGSTSSAMSAPTTPAGLIKIYTLLRDTLSTNKLLSSDEPSFDKTNFQPSVLARCLGFSISAVEIAQRGVASDPGSTLIDKISTQTFTNLKVLSETINSYAAVGTLSNLGANTVHEDFVADQWRQIDILFTGHPLFDSNRAKRQLPLSDSKVHAPLLSQDPFVLFTEFAACSILAWNLDVKHMMRLFYIAEIVRAILAYGQVGVKLPSSVTDDAMEQELEPELAGQVTSLREIVLAGDLVSQQQQLSVSALYRVIESYALPFLRKCIILMHVRFGVDFSVSHSTASSQSETELSRLSSLLYLPDLPSLLSSIVRSDPTIDLIAGWRQHWRDTVGGGVKLAHPAIYELVGLPRNFDTLQDEVMRRKCPSTGRLLSDPALCLVCGEIFCSQAVCCQRVENGRRRYGGCWQHRQKCGGKTGLFLHIRKCCILHLHLGNGSWTVAPYLDRFGEVDVSLRRNLQLFLNQRRYDALLRNLWLGLGIPSAVARRLEGEISTGGFETL